MYRFQTKCPAKFIQPKGG